MKHFFLSILCLSFYSCASFIPVEIENGKALGIMPMQYGRISYQGTHKINASREDIFRQVRRWAAFHTARTVYTGPTTSVKIPTPTTALYIGDNMLGDIISSGTIDPILKQPKTINYWPATHYSASVECYEGYYRITLTNFYTYGLPSAHNLEVRDKATNYKTTKEYYSRVDERVMALITELETFVTNEIRVGGN
jgi:hypothetical protein